LLLVLVLVSPEFKVEELPEDKKAGLIPEESVDGWSPALLDSGPERRRQNPPALRAPNGGIFDIVRYLSRATVPFGDKQGKERRCKSGATSRNFRRPASDRTSRLDQIAGFQSSQRTRQSRARRTRSRQSKGAPHAQSNSFLFPLYNQRCVWIVTRVGTRLYDG